MPPQAVCRGARHPLGVDLRRQCVGAQVGAIGAAGAARWTFSTLLLAPILARQSLRKYLIWFETLFDFRTLRV